MAAVVLGFSEYSPRLTPIQTARKCLELGLGALQITGDYPINFPENIDMQERRDIKRFIQERSLNLHYHAPTDIPLASRHSKLREGGLHRLKEFIELAVEMGAKSFIFHPGRFAYYKIGSGKIVLAQKDIPEIYLERFYQSASRLADYADSRIKLLLENTYSFSEGLVAIIDRFLKLPSTGLVWDIGYSQPGAKDEKPKYAGKQSMSDFFLKRLQAVKLAHLHDTTDGRGHIPLGSGNLDIAPFVDIFKQLNVDMIIEVFSEKDLKSSIEHINSLTGG